MWDGRTLIETVWIRFLNHSLTILWLFFWGQCICFELVYFDEVAKKKKNTNEKWKWEFSKRLNVRMWLFNNGARRECNFWVFRQLTMSLWFYKEKFECCNKWISAILISKNIIQEKEKVINKNKKIKKNSLEVYRQCSFNFKGWFRWPHWTGIKTYRRELDEEVIFFYNRSGKCY